MSATILFAIVAGILAFVDLYLLIQNSILTKKNHEMMKELIHRRKRRAKSEAKIEG